MIKLQVHIWFSNILAAAYIELFNINLHTYLNNKITKTMYIHLLFKWKFVKLKFYFIKINIYVYSCMIFIFVNMKATYCSMYVYIHIGRMVLSLEIHGYGSGWNVHDAVQNS